MTTFTHVMIDLETMGTLYNAPILAIGAVWFDPATGELGKRFYGAIDIEDACRHGRPSGGTIKWWMEQDDEARKAAVAGKHTSAHVFGKFREFLLAPEVAMQPWGNGACFDISMLEYAFLKITGEAAPWKFWNVRDCRTIRELGLASGDKFKGERGGTHHQALDDAIYQAREVSHYWRRLIGHGGRPLDIPLEEGELLG